MGIKWDKNLIEAMLAVPGMVPSDLDAIGADAVAEAMGVNERGFFVTTEPPRCSDPFEDPGHDPYNSTHRPRWKGRLRYKLRLQELEEHPERIYGSFDDTYEVAP